MSQNETVEIAETPEVSEANELQPSAAATPDEHAGHNHAQPTMNPELVREVSVEADADTVSKAFRTVIKKYQRMARIPGFRVGKVPETVIKSRFGKEVREEVMESLVAERFRQAMVDQKLNPISQPQLTNLMLADGAPLKFTAAFEVLPEIDVVGYDSISVVKEDTTLSEAEYQAELGRVMDAHGTVETVEEEREIVDGDWAEIEFKGVLQPGPAVDGEEPEEVEPIIGEDVLIEIGGSNTLPAFTEALRGKKVGQEMEFEVTYPAEFGEPRLAGQTVKYDVTLKTIKKKTFPEKDEEFAKQLGEYESWDDFETKLREMAAGRKKDQAENRAKEKMVEELVTKFQFPVPETFVQQQIDARLDRGLRALQQQGMTAEDMRKLDFNRLREAQREQSIGEVKASLILDRVAEAEGITVREDELERELVMASIQAREPLETMRERMAKDGTIDRIREQMRREKTGTVLYEKLAK